MGWTRVARRAGMQEARRPAASTNMLNPCVSQWIRDRYAGDLARQEPKSHEADEPQTRESDQGAHGDAMPNSWVWRETVWAITAKMPMTTRTTSTRARMYSHCYGLTIGR